MGRRIIAETDQRRWAKEMRAALATAYADQRLRVLRRLDDHGVSLTAATTVPAWNNDEWAKGVTKDVRPEALRIGKEVEQTAATSLAGLATWGMPTKAPAFADQVVTSVLAAGDRFGESLNAGLSALSELQGALGLTAAAKVKPAISIVARAAVEAANTLDSEEVRALLEAAGERDAAAGIAYKAERAREKAERVMREAQSSLSEALDDGPGTFDSLSESFVNSFTQGTSQDSVSYAAHLTGDSSQTEATVTWNAVLDDRTRDAHADADGQTVGLDEPFDVGDEQLYYPGDPSGSDENTINCRCWLTYDGIDDAEGAASQEEG